MHPAPLPGGTRQHLADGLLEPVMGIGDHQLNALPPSGHQASKEVQPEVVGLGRPYVKPQAPLAPRFACPPTAMTAAMFTTRWSYDTLIGLASSQTEGHSPSNGRWRNHSICLSSSAERRFEFG